MWCTLFGNILGEDYVEGKKRSERKQSENGTSAESINPVSKSIRGYISQQYKGKVDLRIWDI